MAQQAGTGDRSCPGCLGLLALAANVTCTRSTHVYRAPTVSQARRQGDHRVDPQGKVLGLSQQPRRGEEGLPDVTAQQNDTSKSKAEPCNPQTHLMLELKWTSGFTQPSSLIVQTRKWESRQVQQLAQGHNDASQPSALPCTTLLYSISLHVATLPSRFTDHVSSLLHSG
uniref:Uncharacterized protein n=1 Tax=Molossus molossus TaxID=27622 RepID=A0A7J8JXC4_MOLMO|nr:hypothetical protein HJG59_008015 [Molossus molossus]